ncbi:MAG TPA: MFS transporter [Limnochordia bacterium]|nr:MFS transporter [Limnochordia bacterium]
MANAPSDPPASAHDPYAAVRIPDFRRFVLGRAVVNVGSQMQSIAVGWELYERTGSALALGYVGLVQVLPVIALALPAGQLADRFNRKRIVQLAMLLMIACSLTLAALSFLNGPINGMYVALFGVGLARAIAGPAGSSLLPQIVPLRVFANATTWASSVSQIASVTGPALGGGIIALTHHAGPVYLLDAFCSLVFFSVLFSIRIRQAAHPREVMTLKSLGAGLEFVWKTKIVLATITMDLFAVLLGGAVMLLPVFAKDILHVGPEGYGLLRAAPSVGALVMAICLAYLPPMRRAGLTLLWAVAGFGAATIVFGLSTSFWLSLAMLFLTGAFDNISVVVRNTLVQVLTPDRMRGRVSAVNNVFIGASNELGGFESGATAAWWGPIASVVIGGLGTIAVVIGIAVIWPQVRRLGSLADQTPADEQRAASA